MTPRIDSKRIVNELETLSRFSDSEPPAITRIVFSRADLEARAWLKDLFVEAGLAVREDAVGNTFARWTGTNPTLSAVGTGSHIDAIPSSGMYDGTVGVLGALEAIRSLRRAGFLPRRSIELVLFTSEEPTRFGIGCLGSRLLAGVTSPDRAASLKDREGNTLESVRRSARFVGDLAAVPIKDKYFSSFVELHIEQGPNLERQGIPIGVVTGIAAPATVRVQIEGEGGHAGATLMPGRRDAFLTAAEIALAVEKAALSSGSIDTVATTGTCSIFPGAVNSIPSRAILEIDVRDVDGARRDRVLEEIRQACQTVAAQRKVRIGAELINADDPAHSSLEIVQILERASQAAGHAYRNMVSRAYHDSLFMARVAPTAMLFIPCRKGVSHRPDEYTSPENIAAGVDVLARTLAELAQ